MKGINTTVDKILDLISDVSLMLDEFKDEQESMVNGIIDDVDEELFEGSDLEEHLEEYLSALNDALDHINYAWDIMDDLPEFEY